MKMQNVKQMDSEYNDIVISPDIAGTDKYVCVGQSFDELLIDRHRVDYVFRFTGVRGKLPAFGVSTLHILDLFWEVVKYDVIENVPSVKIHEWDSEDVKYWKNLELNNETSVHLSIERSESSDIIIQWTHNHTISKKYSFRLASEWDDGYLLILAPWKHFKIKRFAILSPFDYVNATIEDKKDAENSRNFVIGECQACYTRHRNMINLPCGHTPFCWICERRNSAFECAFCRETCENKVEIKKIPELCKLCPKSYGCQNLSCLLLPCKHVVGCFKSASRALQVGEECPNEDCDQIIEEFVKIYLQEPKN